MGVVAFVGEPKIIDKIVRHTKLTFRAEGPPPPHVAQHELSMAAEEREEYFRGPFGCFLSI